ncbi:hypothetical protein [Halobacillus litoralis]|uniref:hypothetical protein n=1 Tax=Halobacillus litoralis TaxID=45668 RepID=UPI001CD3B7BF|nr:hypothetical protein [Halobacillus litoralis]MCA1024274.1 hypothetical protein [Halobacillus litoralis]
MRLYYEGDWIECDSILEEDYEIKEILNILDYIRQTEDLDTRSLGKRIFNLAASPSCLHYNSFSKNQSLANIGYILFTENEFPISRNHLYEKVLLSFFIPK